MDLVDAYSPSHPGLEDFKGLRTRRRRDFSGSYYFGEYLSQGALKIEAKCEIVSAQAILDNRLLSLQPLFQPSTCAQWAGWANEVIHLRETFYQIHIEPELVTDEEMQAEINIAQFFGPRWRLPIVTNLLALRPRQRHDEGLLRAFRTHSFIGSPLPTKYGYADRQRRGESGYLASENEDYGARHVTRSAAVRSYQATYFHRLLREKAERSVIYTSAVVPCSKRLT